MTSRWELDYGYFYFSYISLNRKKKYSVKTSEKLKYPKIPLLRPAKTTPKRDTFVNFRGSTNGVLVAKSNVRDQMKKEGWISKRKISLRQQRQA